MLGCEGAGKTHVLYHCKLGPVRDIAMKRLTFEPTPAFNYEVVPRVVDGTKYMLHMWDLSGNVHVRSMWRHFYSSSTPDVIVFVVDAAPDVPARWTEARDAFQEILHEPLLQNAIKVVLVNVRAVEDPVKSAPHAAIVRAHLGLGPENDMPALTRSYVKIMEVNPLNKNAGIGEALTWMCRRIAEVRSRRPTS